jgi:hypothetical protein
MEGATFICPNTARRVHHWFDGDKNMCDDTYHAVTCLACGRVHLVNPKTGNVLGADRVDRKVTGQVD